MKHINQNKNNELIALVKTLQDKGIVTEAEIKAKKQQLKQVHNKSK